jgi:hypothetical protein
LDDVLSPLHSPWVKWALAALPVAALVGSAVFTLLGELAIARV